LAFATAGLAQAGEQDPPFRGKVTGSHVNIRMAPSKDGLIVRVAREGEGVLVVGKEGTWFRIAPPENAGCWIHHDSVKKSEGGSIVTRDSVLRSDSRNNAPEVGRIAKGESVKIMAEKVDWYKIQAPPSVAMYVHGDYVAFDRAYDPQVDGAIAAASPHKGAKPDADKPGSVKGPAAGAHEKSPAEPKGMTADEAESKRQAEIRKLKDDLERIKRSYEREVREVTAKKPEPRKTYDAVGHVDSVGLTLNRPGTHVLVSAQKVVCYLKSGRPEQLDLDRYYNKLVGVRGRAEPAKGYEPLQVITVDSIEPIVKE
jgi:uncharacterized protein YgiM (DUF1202 family)